MKLPNDLLDDLLKRLLASLSERRPRPLPRHRLALAATRRSLLVCVPLLAWCTAQAQPGLGRLFNTPQERQAIDASRGKPAGAATVQGAPGMAGALAPAMPPDMQAAMPQGTRPGFAPDIVPELPPNLPPGMLAGMTAMARVSREHAPTSGPQQQYQPQPMPGAAPATDSATAQLTMNGVLRSSNGRSTVWLNNVPQRGAANKFSNRDSKAVTVTLPSGRRIVLQPGQRYDLADGRVKELGQ